MAKNANRGAADRLGFLGGRSWLFKKRLQEAFDIPLILINKSTKETPYLALGGSTGQNNTPLANGM